VCLTFAAISCQLSSSREHVGGLAVMRGRGFEGWRRMNGRGSAVSMGRVAGIGERPGIRVSIRVFVAIQNMFSKNVRGGPQMRG